ncbi:MAG: hypothetical protein E7620_03880 [Ruminococcaceae bacterium]|nr:hypothetical protein [Oscillospiraceae bacterium]
MTNETNYVVKKKSTWWSIIKALIVIAVVTYAAYKIYAKFFKKKKAPLDIPMADELPTEALAEEASDSAFEASAEEVIEVSEEEAE